MHSRTLKPKSNAAKLRAALGAQWVSHSRLRRLRALRRSRCTCSRPRMKTINNTNRCSAKVSANFTSADEVVLAADELVVDSFNDLDESKIPDVLGKIPDVDVKLSAAKSFAESAKEGVSGDDEKAADQLAASAEARKTMLELAEAILTEEQAAKQASNLMASCWENVLSADALLREAAELVTDTNEENTRASQKKCEQAREFLTQASSQFEQAQALYPADYGPFDDYIAARQQSIAYAIASDEAIYVQDKATADSNNESTMNATLPLPNSQPSFPKPQKRPLWRRSTNRSVIRVSNIWKYAPRQPHAMRFFVIISASAADGVYFQTNMPTS